ncbi:MAG TPA: MarR family transcriptional regulator [Gaiellales bacterium]|nr:MarR family transcriptional regulator [Gaiellales bacterium]
MARPDGPPIGLHLATTSKQVGRAFNRALGESGGSVPVWLILSSLKGERWRTQQDLARAVGIEGPTLTRHVDAMEHDGLVTRHRDTGDRRAVRVELTEAGEALHAELLRAVIAFNRRLRRGLAEHDIAQLRELLDRLAANVG